MKTPEEIVQMMKEMDTRTKLATDPHIEAIYSAMTIALGAVVAEEAGPYLSRLLRSLKQLERGIAALN